MLLTEAVIYLFPVFTKRKKRQFWPSTFSLHPIAALMVGEGGDVFVLGVQRPCCSLVSSLCNAEDPVATVWSDCAGESLRMG